jgi:hypothetical protein
MQKKGNHIRLLYGVSYGLDVMYSIHFYPKVNHRGLPDVRTGFETREKIL